MRGDWPGLRRRKARNQTGKRVPFVITDPCRGRFYIGPACGGADTPGGINPAPTDDGTVPGQTGNYNPAALQTRVGDDACIVPGTSRRHRAPRTGSPAQEPPLRGGWPPKRACGRSKSRPYE